MSNVRMLLAAALMAVPAAVLAATTARAESWQDHGRSRSVAEFGHSGGHHVNSHRTHEVNRAHGENRHHADRRHHRPLLDVVPRRRHNHGDQ